MFNTLQGPNSMLTDFQVTVRDLYTDGQITLVQEGWLLWFLPYTDTFSLEYMLGEYS